MRSHVAVSTRIIISATALSGTGEAPERHKPIKLNAPAILNESMREPHATARHRTPVHRTPPHATARHRTPTHAPSRYSNGTKSRRVVATLEIQETSIGSELCGKSAAWVPRAVAVVNK